MRAYTGEEQNSAQLEIDEEQANDEVDRINSGFKRMISHGQNYPGQARVSIKGSTQRNS